MDAPRFLVIAVDHPSLDGSVSAFLDELRQEQRFFGRRSSACRKPFPSLIERLAARRTMRLGVLHGQRLIAMASVDNGGAVALAVAADFRRQGVGDQLMSVVSERAAAIGYPPLHRFSARRVRLAG